MQTSPVYLHIENGPSLKHDDIRRLHGKIVLAESAQDHRNPPTGVRGTLEVRDDEGGNPAVFVALEFPQMFTARAHHRTVRLSPEEVVRLLASERNGTFEIVLPGRLDPDAPAGNE